MKDLGAYLRWSALVLLLFACALGWNVSAAGLTPSAQSGSLRLPSIPGDITAELSTLQFPGISSALADFDGDQQIDIAVGRQTGNDFAIDVHFTRHPGVTVLRSAGSSLAGLTLVACDINKDSFPDIVATAPSAPHPVAVWLGDGKGGFTAVDQNRFANDFGLATSNSLKQQKSPFEQPLYTGPLRPVCETPASAFEILRPEPNRFTIEQASWRLVTSQCAVPSLRSPPSFSVS